MTGRWDQKGVPHKGWHCVGMDDLGAPDGNCDMCGREEIRYVHYMEHSEYDGHVAAGCVCAEKMEEGYIDNGGTPRAKDRERALRNAAARRSRWTTLKGWRNSKNGNPYISRNGFHIVVFKQGSKYKSRIEHKDLEKTYYSKRGFDTIEEAKLSAFDATTFLQQ